MQINLSDWASLVQDVAASLQALPPGLSNYLDPAVLNLLQHLEVVTQVKFAASTITQRQTVDVQEYLCRLPLPRGARLRKGLQFMGVTASSGGVTTPITSLEVCPDLCHLHQVSPFGTHLLGRPLYHSSWSQPHCTDLLLGAKAKGHSEHKGSGATGSSESTSNPVSADSAATD